MTPRRFRFIPAVALVTLMTGITFGANLLTNPTLEGGAGDRLPPHWEAVNVGPEAQFAVDPLVRREGRPAVRIKATESVRSYVQSEPIHVAPGEEIRASAWVRFQDVPGDRGHVIIIAEFLRPDGGRPTVQMVGTANRSAGQDSDWQHVRGTVRVPALVNRMRLRLGFSYAEGTAWWSDASVEAVQPVVARIELASPRISPGLGGIPVAILNRDRQRGAGEVRITLGQQTAAAPVRLTGEPVQHLLVPIDMQRRGRMQLSLALHSAGEPEPIFSDSRQVNILPPMTLAPPIPTHWVIEDGPPQIEGDIELALVDAQRRGARLVISLVNGRGETLASYERVNVPDGVSTYSLTHDALPEGRYNLIAELRPRNGEPIRAEHPWHVIPRRLAHVTMDEDGYPVYDGQRIFALGMFNGPGRMAEMGEAGFTVSHAYNAAEAIVGGRLDSARVLDFLDNTQEAGLKALLLVPRHPLFEEDWDTIRRHIRMFRNHPALLAWDQEEGMARGDMTLDTHRRLFEIIREEDPHHPLMVGDSRDAIRRITDRSDFFPVNYMDLGMWWWYPLPPGGARADLLQGEELVEAKELAPPSFLTLRQTDKPIWIGVQSYKKPQPWARYPEPIEYRAQAYIAVIHGAKGLMWYGGSVQGGLFLNPEEGHWDYLKQLVGELREMSEVFMAADEAPPLFEPSDAKISVALKRLPDRLVLLAVNRAAEPAEVTFRSEHLPSGPAAVLFEDRQVQIEAGALRDHFEPYETHVYELRVE